MKYVIGFFIFFLILFVVYAGLVVAKSDEGVFDTCIYDFEKCVLVDNTDTCKPIRILKCSDRAFLCNLRSLYYSFVDEKRLDDEYNEYFMNLLAKEIEHEELLKKLNGVKENADTDSTLSDDSPSDKKDEDKTQPPAEKESTPPLPAVGAK